MRTKEEIEQKIHEIDYKPYPVCFTEGVIRLVQKATLEWVMNKRKTTDLYFDLVDEVKNDGTDSV